MDDFASISGDVRTRTSALIRERQEALSADIGSAISRTGAVLDPHEWRGCAEVLLRLFAASVDSGPLDAQSAVVRDLARYAPPLNTRQLLNCVHHAERVILDELALDAGLGATSEPWAVVAHAIRRATLEILGAHAEQLAGGGSAMSVRDPLTTLIVGPVFLLALEQEIERSLRHQHALSIVLFDIDDLAQINREQGWGVGDRVLERMGILARRFFRTHDWVARLSDDAIVVLLPETTLDQAAVLAARFRETVEQRLVQQDHKTQATTIVSVSAAAVGTDLVHAEIDAASVITEAEAAAMRARFYGGRHRIERVALLPTAVTIVGAAAMLGLTPHDVSRLVRDGTLKATRRGRHFHIDRDQVESFRKRTR